MEEEGHREMALLSHSSSSQQLHHHQPWPSDPPMMKFQSLDQFGGPSLDLQLSISVSSNPPSDCVLIRKVRKYKDHVNMDVEALKWQAAEQIRLAAVEKAYAERVRELTRREMELAQSEFARARHMWERAREEVERAEELKERAATCQKIDHSITCYSCRQRFKP